MSALDVDELERLARALVGESFRPWRQEREHDAWTEVRAGRGPGRMVADCLSTVEGAYVAACSPDRVLELINRLRAVEARLGNLDRLTVTERVFRRFALELAKGAKGRPEDLWRLLGYDVEDSFTCERRLNLWAEDVRALLGDVNGALETSFEAPAPLEEAEEEHGEEECGGDGCPVGEVEEALERGDLDGALEQLLGEEDPEPEMPPSYGDVSR